MTVLKKSKELIKYQSSQNAMMYFNILAANQDDYCWLVSSSSVGYTAAVPTGTFLPHQLVLPEEEPACGTKRSLEEALESPQKSTILGRIVQVSPLTHRREGTLAVRSLCIKDRSSKLAKVCLFEKNATASYMPDSVVEVTGVYSKTFQNRVQLTSTTDTTCQFLSDDTLLDVKVKEDDWKQFKDDPDFTVNDETTSSEPLIIDIIFDVVTYQCCTVSNCRKKKMVEGKCPTCSGTSSEITFRVKVALTREDGTSSTITIFEKTAVEIFGQVNFDEEDDLVCVLVSKLPVHFTGKVSRNNLYDIIV